MNSKFLSLVAGVATLGLVGAANAAEPMQLTPVQLDTITAAGDNTVTNTAYVTQTADYNFKVGKIEQEQYTKIIQVGFIIDVDKDVGKDKGHRGHRGHRGHKR
jgi:hypothetical protein